jgi:type II secretory pathway pseudopilin PulG
MNFLRQKIAAFSLIETLMALLIIGLILSVSWSMINQTVLFDAKISSSQARTLDIEFALDVLRSDLKNSEKFVHDNSNYTLNSLNDRGDELSLYRYVYDPERDGINLKNIVWRVGPEGISRSIKTNNDTFDEYFLSTFEAGLTVVPIGDGLIRVTIFAADKQWLAIYEIS